MLFHASRQFKVEHVSEFTVGVNRARPIHLHVSCSDAKAQSEPEITSDDGCSLRLDDRLNIDGNGTVTLADGTIQRCVSCFSDNKESTFYSMVNHF